MIMVCKRCVPDEWRAVSMPILWNAPSHTCALCRKACHWADLLEVNATEQDLRFTQWVNSYERGSR